MFPTAWTQRFILENNMFHENNSDSYDIKYSSVVNLLPLSV